LPRGRAFERLIASRSLLSSETCSVLPSGARAACSSMDPRPRATASPKNASRSIHRPASICVPRAQSPAHSRREAATFSAEQSEREQVAPNAHPPSNIPASGTGSRLDHAILVAPKVRCRRPCGVKNGEGMLGHVRPRDGQLRDAEQSRDGAQDSPWTLRARSTNRFEPSTRALDRSAGSRPGVSGRFSAPSYVACCGLPRTGGFSGGGMIVARFRTSHG
jgi:hypothetical protein